MPATVAAEWLAAVWDQCASLFALSPAAVVAEEVASSWLLDVLGLPSSSQYRFCHRLPHGEFHGARGGALRAAPSRRLGRRAERSCRRASVSRHRGRRRFTSRSSARCGCSVSALPPSFGWRPTLKGGCVPSALASALAESDAPAIVCAQAGNVNTGAFDPLRADRRIWSLSAADGCTWTAPLDSGPVHAKPRAISPQASPEPIRGRPMPTNG